MKRMIWRRLAVAGAAATLILTGACAPAMGASRPVPVRSPIEALRFSIDSLVNDPMFANAQIGLLIVNPRTGDTLYSRNAGKLFMPASNQKLLTSSVALHQLGPNYRFRTVIGKRGELRDGVLNGDLFVVGRGDPSISDRMRGSAYTAMQAIADSLSARGIRRINGALRPGGNAFPDSIYAYGWEYDDLTSSGTPTDELLFNEGQVRFIRRTPRGDTIDYVGTRNPTLAYLAALDTALRARGVVSTGISDSIASITEPFDTVYVFDSPPLRDILPPFLKPSQNQIGEILLKTLGLERTGVGIADSGAVVVTRQLKEWGVDSSGVLVYDGSGLSRHDLVSPETVVKILLAMQRDTAFQVFYDRSRRNDPNANGRNAGCEQSPCKDRNDRVCAVALRLRERCGQRPARVQLPVESLHRSCLSDIASAGRCRSASREIQERPGPLISVPEASGRILGAIHPLAPETVATENAAGRVLAASVVAPLTSPPWDNSSMDGYAVRSVDLPTSDPPVLRVVETVAAGSFPSRAITAGESMRVMTGAPVPDGADSVIRHEDTDDGRDVVTIRSLRDSGKNIRKAGEDFHAGDVLFPAGEAVRVAHIGVLASAGVKSIQAHRRPRVAIISSGDELVELRDFNPDIIGKRVVSSNSVTLFALVRDAGGEPVDLGIARDDPVSLKEKLAAASDADLILTSAGISVGDHDHVRESFTESGGEIDFWKVRMRPGAPLAFGMLHGKPWIGVSGNPVSAIVSFEVLVRPVIRKMLGNRSLFRETIPVTLRTPITITAPLMHFIRAVITPGADGSYMAEPAGSQSSSVLTAMARANALLILPGDRLQLEPGEMFRALPLGDALQTTDTLVLT
ncbi:MAG: gephyrin-like molybdotransferase Glp [Gemmatimonadales bacterium]